MAAVNMMTDPARSKVRLQGVSDESLSEVFNDFFTRFEEHNFSFYMSDLKSSLMFDKTAVIDQKSVANCLKMININKSPGPGGICGRTLKVCADQLSGVFQHLFQTSLDTASIPTVWKTSTVIPIPKTNNPKQLNDFRPVALTSLVMKTLEKTSQVTDPAH